MLFRILSEYASAQLEDFHGHALARFVRDAGRTALPARLRDDFRVKGSAGINGWAETPWVAIMSPLVTISAQRGFYVVYLFNAQEGAAYLSLRQGVMAVERAFGAGPRTRAVLEARAAIMRSRLRPTARLTHEPIRMSKATPLSRSYEWGHVLGARYALGALPAEDDLVADLDEAILAYKDLILQGGSLLDDGDDEDRALRLHRLHERRAAGRRVIRRKGRACEACGFDFRTVYGSLGDGFAEIHHLRPLDRLVEDAARLSDLDEDFAVLCANCHRMIHRLDDVSDLDALRDRIKRL